MDLKYSIKGRLGGSVEHPTSAQVMISWFVSSNPASGSLLSAQRPLQILLPPLSLCPSSARVLSLKNDKQKKVIFPILNPILIHFLQKIWQYFIFLFKKKILSKSKIHVILTQFHVLSDIGTRIFLAAL